MAKPRLVKLIGGTRDGETVEVQTWQPLVYMTKRISIADGDALDIDGVMKWKNPEEVYERNADGDFVYTRTVHYKPDDAVPPG